LGLRRGAPPNDLLGAETMCCPLLDPIVGLFDGASTGLLKSRA